MPQTQTVQKQAVRKLRYYAGGWKESKTSKYMDCYDPSTGEVIAQAPQCTPSEVEEAIAAAAAAFPAWADTPPSKRVQVLFRMKALLDKHLDELTLLVAKEHGKVMDEAMGDAVKVTEVVEFACGIPHLMKGPAHHERHLGLRHDAVHGAPGRVRRHRALELPGHDSHGMDGPAVHRHRQHAGAQGRQLRAAVRHADHGAVGGGRAAQGRHQPGDLLPQRGGDPPPAPRRQGRHASSAPPPSAGTSTPPPPPTASACRPSPRPRTTPWCCRDAALERTARGIVNSACGCAGERCMALPVVVVEEAIADKLVGRWSKCMKELKVGPAYDKTSQLGPAGQRGPPAVGHQLDPEGRRRGREARAGRPQGHA